MTVVTSDDFVSEPEAAEPVAEVSEAASSIHDVSADREAALGAAVAAIAAGDLVVLPTDTVYGIGADAMDPAAVQRLLDAKVRGRDMPPPVLISDALALGSVAEEVPAAAKALTRAFWPGALTIIVKAQSGLTMDLGETQGTIAVRVPDHDVARDLLRRTGPLAVSSANISGLPAANTAAQAHEMLSDSVAVYLEAGECGGGQASSIVDFTTHDGGRLVRLGALSVAQLREHAPDLDAGEFEPVVDAPEPVDAPEVAGGTELVNDTGLAGDTGPAGDTGLAGDAGDRAMAAPAPVEDATQGL